MPIDWSNYERVHADRRNLRIHLLAVPLFDIALPYALVALLRGNVVAAAAAALIAAGSMTLQALGHSMEQARAAPFGGPVDFLKRWFAEQYFKFPAFVLTGRWWRQYRAAR